jgi:hypothetical protein
MSANDVSAEEDPNDEAAALGEKKRLQFNAEVWNYLGVPKGGDKKFPTCQHCQVVVRAQFHIARVVSHLQDCLPFYTWLESNIPKNDWPEFACNKKPKLTHESSGSGSSSSSSSSSGGYFPKLSQSNKAKFKAALAKYFYMTGIPFKSVESKCLLGSLQMLRPDVELPTEHVRYIHTISTFFTSLVILSCSYAVFRNSL